MPVSFSALAGRGVGSLAQALQHLVRDPADVAGPERQDQVAGPHGVEQASTTPVRSPTYRTSRPLRAAIPSARVRAWTPGIGASPAG